MLSVPPTEIRPAEPFEIEFKITNTGRAPIEVPVNPHLSDLQPSDESVAFSYLNLALVVRGDGGLEAQGQNVPALGFVELYGSDEHDGSIVELRPAEWIRVKAAVKLTTAPRAGLRTSSGELLAAKKHFPRPVWEYLHRNTQPLPKRDSNSVDTSPFA